MLCNKYLNTHLFPIILIGFLFIFEQSKAEYYFENDLQIQDEFHPKHGFIIIPSPPPNIINPISLKSEDVEILLKDGAAKVEKTQIFHNNCYSTVEGIYAFPLPEGSVISNFSMYMGSQKVPGQVLSAAEARKIYEDIVRRRRDPALLEFMGQSLFQARIFPITANEDKRIDIKYDQLVKFDNNTYRFIYPISAQILRKNIGILNLNLNINSSKPITNIYSPTHKIRVDQKNDFTAKVTFSLENQANDKDFILYYSVSDKNIGASLITHKPFSGEKGYFCLNLSPKYEINKKELSEKDIIFILDASGSMLGEKISQAKDALKYCLNNLNKGDRFALIDFSNDVRKFNDNFVKYDNKTKDDALYYIDKLEATGGTNLNEAMLTGLKMKRDSKDRPALLILLTDGLPTVGIKNPNEIVTNSNKNNSENMRIFTFGVGYDVDVFLLDKISSENFGSSNYVKPGENLETELSSFYSKISTPVLSDITVSYSGIEVSEIYPKRLPDLFYKGQITVLGRYDKPGPAKITVEGKVGQIIQKFSFDLNFEEKERENDFVANLWANRKVGYLLDQIRMNGDNKEMTEEIIRLAKKYGIITPYTSYLVTEEESKTIGMNQPIMQQDHLFDRGSGSYRAVDEKKKEGMVSQSITIQNMQTINTVNEIKSVKTVKGKTFIKKNGVWIDSDMDEKAPMDTKIIVFGSDEYFNLIFKKPEIADYLKIGDKILLIYNGKCYKID